MSILDDMVPELPRRPRPTAADLDRYNREVMERVNGRGRMPGVLAGRQGEGLMGMSATGLAATAYGALLFGSALLAMADEREDTGDSDTGDE